MKAVWNGAVIAESDDTIVIEISHYFPPDSVHREYLVESDTHTSDPQLGDASYYTLMVDLDENRDAAFYYPQPKAGSIEQIGRDYTNYVTFTNGVEIREN